MYVESWVEYDVVDLCIAVGLVLITMRKGNYAKGGSTENSGAGLMARGAVL